ncbi:MAG: tetratricopeptide repeat protein [Myxococcota bacterium]
MSPQVELDEAAAEAEAEALAEAEAATESTREVSPSLVVADRATLVDAGDAEGLIAMAKAYRAGSMGLKRDPRESFLCYEAAAEMGDLSAKHAVGVFYLMGGLGESDEEQAAIHLRAAANAGFTLSKIYIANFYELGIHYAANAEKADVWYRSVARAAGVEHEEDTPEYVRAMAELGCVRYCLILRDAEDSDDDERRRFAKKARAYGYSPERIRRREAPIAVAASSTETTAPVPSDDAPAPPSPEAQAQAEAPANAEEALVKPTPRFAWGDAGAAIILSMVTMGVAVGLGWAITVIAPEVAAGGQPWPVIGDGHPLALPVLVATIGFLPNFLVYKLVTIIKAMVPTAALGGLGYYLWMEQLLQVKTLAVQVSLFAAGGLLLSLYAFALLGGVRVGWDLAHGFDPWD